MQSPLSLTVSIVSHRNGGLIGNLLGDLREQPADYSQIIITLNVPEEESFFEKFADLPITVVRNTAPMGFGENHNQAFRMASGHLFAVVNPDIRISKSPFARLAMAAKAPGVGASAPVVLSPGGAIEDNVRQFPTVGRLAVRVLLKRRLPHYRYTPDANMPVDWAAGMFIVFNREAFKSIGGFDTHFFMYFEDADICRRLWDSGYSVLLVPGAEVVHDAQRNSHSDAQHFRWHLRSAMRFLFGL